MLVTFYLTFHVIGQRLSDWLEVGVSALTTVADHALTAYGINPVVHSLIIDGIFAGVGSVLVFLPIIVTLFFFLSILEDTGYMARVAFVMDKPLRKIGLSGRSIVPMLIGFGCFLRPGPENDNSVDTLYELFCQNIHLCLLHRCFLPEVSGLGDDVTVFAGYHDRHCCRSYHGSDSISR